MPESSSAIKLVEVALSKRPVDWNHLEESSSDEEERRLVDNLRLVRRVADFNRLLVAGVAPNEVGRHLAASAKGAPGEAASGTGGPHAGLDPGTRWGKLELRKGIGSGAFADVYLAYDSDLEREVALKLYRNRSLKQESEHGVASPEKEALGPGGAAREDPKASKERRRAIMREARLMARVQHPNVVAIHGAEEIDGQAGLWMDFIKGRTLQDWVRGQGRLGSEEATLIGLDLCRALAAVHSRGLTHQDIKAQNVMREEGGRIVLMDFGIGLERPEEGDDPMHSTSGTPAYMAPEKLLRGESSVASDVYSLGVLIYYLVTGRYPLEASTLSDLIRAHKEGKRTLLRDARPELPKAFIDAVERALAPEPKDRYASMGEMEKALTAALGMTEQASRVSRRAPAAVRWRTLRYPLLILGLAGIAPWVVHRWGDRLTSHSATVTRQLTQNVEGNPVRSAAISPDGRVLAYTDRAGLYLRDVETGETNLLPQFGDTAIFHIQWFPDNRKLLVIHAYGDTVRTCTVSLITGAQERLCMGMALLIPPDYERVLVVGASDTARVLNLQGGDVASIVFPKLPDGSYLESWSMSPSGERVVRAVADSSGRECIKSWDLRGRNETSILDDVVLSGSYTMSDLIWMASGWLVYSTRGAFPRHRHVEIQRLKVDPKTGRPSGKPHRVAAFEDGHFPGDLTASKDGKRLVSLQELLQVETNVADLSNGGETLGPVRRFTHCAADDRPFGWMPDGRGLILGSDRNGSRDLFAQDLGSDVARILVPNRSGDEWGARVSPQGRELLYWASAKSVWESTGASDSVGLWIMPLGGGMSRLLRRAASASKPGFDCSTGSGGRCVYAAVVGSVLRFEELDLDSGAGRILTDCECSESEEPKWTLSPDGCRAAIVDGSGSRPGIRLLDLASGKFRELAVRDGHLFQMAYWAPDGKSLYASGWSKSRQNTLFRVSLDGQVSFLLQRPVGEDCWLAYPTPSPDGTHLAFVEILTEANAWMFEGF
jgi:eukaryotic-like serine/threonine-protein kinase